MKLELKHIQHYPIRGDNALRVDFEGVAYKLAGLFTTSCAIELGNTTCVPSLQHIKPILRPLSDLTREIDGIIHGIELAKLVISNKKHNNLMVDSNGNVEFDCRIITKPFGKALKVTSGEQWIIYMSLDEPQRRPFFEIEYLLQHHFDIYNLIEKGLALDINQIKE